MNVGIRLSPMGSRIKIEFQGKLYCTRGGGMTKLQNSITLDSKDIMVNTILGGRRRVKAFLKRNRVENMVINRLQAGLDSCEVIC